MPSARETRPAAPAPGEPSFEAALERLHAIVEELERGELTLDESIARYEEGMRLSQRLTQSLDEAEKRIERLIERDDRAVTRPMELENNSNRVGEPTEDEGQGGEPDEDEPRGGELPF